MTEDDAKGDESMAYEQKKPYDQNRDMTSSKPRACLRRPLVTH